MNSVSGEDGVGYVRSSFLQLFGHSQTSLCLLPLLGLLWTKLSTWDKGLKRNLF